MRLTKKQRQIVWDKSGGKCWYCGCDLPEHGWHADHVIAVVREIAVVQNKPGSMYSHRITSTNKTTRPEHDTIDNMVPACAPCNLFKTCLLYTSPSPRD